MRSKSFELLHSLRETPIGHEISVKECFYILNLEISLLEVVGHVLTLLSTGNIVLPSRSQVLTKLRTSSHCHGSSFPIVTTSQECYGQ